MHRIYWLLEADGRNFALVNLSPACLCRDAERKQRTQSVALAKSALLAAEAGIKQGANKAKKDLLRPRKVGPVYVQILDQLPQPTASGEKPCCHGSPIPHTNFAC